MTEEVAGEIAELKRDFDNLDDEIAVRASATRSHIAGPGEVSIAFPLDEKRDVVPGGSGGERSGGARNLLYLASCSLELRASGAVGLRWQAGFGSSDRLE